MTALITGGDSGIGRAAAVAFVKEGADVAIAYLNERGDAEMTKQYIDCIQESIDQSSQEYYESKESLAGEWKRRYGASEE